MEKLISTPEGLKIILGFMIVVLDCMILLGTIAGVPGKENRLINLS